VKRHEIRWAAVDALNQRLQTVTTCPLTSQLHPTWRTRVGGQSAEIAVDRIRTVSKARLGRRLGALSNEETGALRRLITEMYGEYCVDVDWGTIVWPNDIDVDPDVLYELAHGSDTPS
jgi:mRNA interferase MazF